MKCFYSDNYSFPLPEGHPFPMHKYEDAARHLVASNVIAAARQDGIGCNLAVALRAFKPDLAIYLDGVDVHEDDRFGQMKLTSAEMRERDLYTMTLLRSQNLPVATVFGGGYNKDRALTPLLHCQTVRLAAGLAGP